MSQVLAGCSSLPLQTDNPGIEGTQCPSIREAWQQAKASGEWQDWHWQFRNRVQTIEALRALIPLSREEENAFKASGKNLPFAVTPYYFELVEADNPNGPIRKTVIPRVEEFTTTPHEMVDPLSEDGHMPVPGLVHRYPDRVLFLINDTCSVYCRYCTRSRVVGSHDLRPGI